MTTKITLSTPRDLVQCIPDLLGYQPSDGDVVVVFFTGSSVMVCARVQIEGISALLFEPRLAVADSFVLVSYGVPEDVTADAASVLASRWEDRTAPITVNDGWLRCLCGEPGCEPEPVPGGTSPVAAAAVTVGQSGTHAESRSSAAAAVLFTDSSGIDPTSYPAVMASTVASRDVLLMLIGSADREIRHDFENEVRRQLAKRSASDDPDVVDALACMAAVAAFIDGSGFVAQELLTIASPDYSLGALLAQLFSVSTPEQVATTFAEMPLNPVHTA